MAFVLDASIALAWCFEDEKTAATERVLKLFLREEAFVPPLWPLEVSNALLAATRARRIKAVEVERFLALVRGLPIEIEPLGMDGAFGQALPLAREHGLSVYDAAYLEIALRRGIGLATLDTALRRAARRVGVRVA